MSENGGTSDRDQHLSALTTSSGRTSSGHASAAAASLARLNSSSSLASSIASAEERLQSEMQSDSVGNRPTTSQGAAATVASSIRGPPHERLDSYGDHIGPEQPTQVTSMTSTHPAEERGDLAVSIRFGEGPDLSLHVAQLDTVADVKEKIKAARPAIENKYLRLIHAGKILADEKTMIESLPKSLFTHYEVPVEPSTRSRISTSFEAAVNHILTSHPHQQHQQDKSRTSHDSLRRAPLSAGSVTASLGSILPTHIMQPETSIPFSSEDETHPSIPSSNKGKGKANDYVAIDIPPEDSASTLDATANTTIKTSIPLQTGPIYILCSISDLPPNQRLSSSIKGKAVASNRSIDSNGTMTSTRTGRVRRGGGPAGRSRIGEGSSSTSSSPSNMQQQQHQRGGEQEADSEEDEENQEDTALLSPVIVPPATGFDRLREAGFSEEEIRSIRREFHASRQATDSSLVGENGIEVEQNEDAEAQARRIEDEWIDRHGSETLPEGLEGSYGEMVWGLMLGFFMGLISLFWFKEATFTRRQQMGIVAGMTLNLVFGILRFL